jgi:hypothetical protein
MRRSPGALGVDRRSLRLPPRAVLDHYVTSVIFFARQRFYGVQAKIASQNAGKYWQIPQLHVYARLPSDCAKTHATVNRQAKHILKLIFMKRALPAIGLFFLAPLIAEFLLGDLPITLLPP